MNVYSVGTVARENLATNGIGDEIGGVGSEGNVGDGGGRGRQGTALAITASRQRRQQRRWGLQGAAVGNACYGGEVGDSVDDAVLRN